MTALTSFRRAAAHARHFSRPASWLSRGGAGVFVVAALVTLQTQATPPRPSFQIQSATPNVVPAGANGATLTLTGTLPNFAQGQYQVCFYTGFGSTAAITPALTTGPVSIAVPASTIQAIPAAQFNAQNNFAFPAAVYIVPSNATCTGSFDANLTNSLVVPIAEPLLGGVTGPATVPQTNPATSIPAPPRTIVLTGSGFAASTVVTLGSFGALTPTILSPTALSVPVPPAFSSSPAGTTAAVTVCNASSVGNFCSGLASPVTLSVAALAPSVGALTVTPTPVATTGTTVLTAQFKRDPSSTAGAEPGAPSGRVRFTAGGTAAGSALLVLDSAAVFVPQSTTTQIATTATPLITPAAGTYASAQLVTIADATPGAAIYYTADGSTPTAASTAYTGPFTISTTQTITAIAVASGAFASAVASNAYTIFVPTPTSVAFVVQPATSATGTPIAPPVSVAVQDQNGNTITTSSAAVTVAIAANPAQGVLSGTKTVNAVNGIATFSDLSIDAIGNGYTLLATSPALASATSTAFNITPYPISVRLFDPLIGVTSTLPGTFTLSHPAPAGGVTVSLASSNTSFVTVSPASVSVPAGGTSGSFNYTGVATGTASITASATNYLAGSGSVTVTNSLVSLGTIPPVAPGQTVSLALSIATNAPAGGVTINFTSSNPSVATITSSVFIPQGQRTAAANPQIVGLTIGTTTITATAQGYAPDTRSVNVTVVAAFNPTSSYLNLATSNNTSLTISAPAITGGLTFTLSSDDPTKATVPSSVTIPAGQTSVPVPITGVANGSTTIRADSPGVTEATFGAYVSSTLTVNTQTTGVNVQETMSVSLPSTSPTPVTITVTSSNPGVVLLSTSPTTVGSATLTFNNVTTNSIPTIYEQGQAVGTSTITASGPGYTTGSNTITVDPSGFTFNPYGGATINTTTFAAATSFSIVPAILDPQTFNFLNFATVNPGLGAVNVTVTSSNTTTGTIVTSPVIFHAGDSSQNSSLQPSSAGTSNITLGVPSGFHAINNYNSVAVTVTAPQLSVSPTTSGVSMEVATGVSVPSPPSTPETVTVTVADPTVATISTSSTTIGTASVTFQSNAVPNLFVQGQKIGTTGVTISAAGYTSGTATFTVNPSGFSFNPYSGTTLNTTTFSAVSGLSIVPVILDAQTFNFVNFGTISPGTGPFSVPVTSSNTNVGTITTSPVIFRAGDTQLSTNFQPNSAGTTNLTVGAPAGFHVANNYAVTNATVTAPQLTISNVTTGAGLELGGSIYVPTPPATPEAVTITVADPTVATISTSVSTVGTASVTFMSNAVPPLYVQGQKPGSTAVTISAAGYTSGTATITVDLAGFNFNPYAGSSFSTTTFSSPSGVSITPVVLDPQTRNFVNFATINPGTGPISVAVTSSNTNVGNITTSPIVFHAGDTSQTANFQPTSAGTSNLTLGVPAGFSAPNNYNNIVVTVTAPSINISNVVTGANLYNTTNVYLSVAPPNPVTVTVTSNGPAIATISSSGTVVGGTTLTFTNVTTAGSLPAIYVQGQSVGTTTLTVSAPGYTNGIANITVDPAGFTFAGNYNGGLTAPRTNGSVSIPVYASILNPGTLTYYGTGSVNPGLGAVNVTLTSSTPSTGTISSPISFAPTDQYHYANFTPVANGSTTVSITQPTGFSQPSQYVQINATVQ